MRLADAAVRVLAQRGPHGLTHRAIDAEADVPKGTASNYFASRDEIIDAILLRISERLQPDPGVHADLAEESPSVDLFAAYLRGIVHRLTSDRDAAIALFELRLEATRRPAVADALATWRRHGPPADIQFNPKTGPAGAPAAIARFHYAPHRARPHQLTVPIDDDADPETLATTLAHRILQR